MECETKEKKERKGEERDQELTITECITIPSHFCALIVSVISEDPVILALLISLGTSPDCRDSCGRKLFISAIFDSPIEICKNRLKSKMVEAQGYVKNRTNPTMNFHIVCIRNVTISGINCLQ